MSRGRPHFLKVIVKMPLLSDRVFTDPAQRHVLCGRPHFLKVAVKMPLLSDRVFTDPAQ